MLRCSGPLTWPRLAWRRRSALCKRDSWCSWAKVTLGFRNFSQDFYTRKKDSTKVRKHSIQHAEKTTQTHRFSICLMNMDEVWKNDKKLNTRLILKGDNTQIAMFTSIAQGTTWFDINQVDLFFCFASDKQIIKTCSTNTYIIYIYIHTYILHIELKKYIPTWCFRHFRKAARLLRTALEALPVWGYRCLNLISPWHHFRWSKVQFPSHPQTLRCVPLSLWDLTIW